MKRTARLAAALLAGMALAAGGYVGALVLLDSPGFAWRVLRHGQSNPADLHLFPARPISPAAEPMPIAHAPDTAPDPALRALIERSGTHAFLWYQHGRVIAAYTAPGQEGALHTSFSVAKSVLALLIGIAIEEGHLGGLDDRLTDHLPELRGLGFDDITLGDLLAMEAGIAYRPADGLPLPLRAFSDDALTYYAPDLRRLALRARADASPPGFRYNNYHPLLLGMVLERATGQPVARYLQERLWQPMGAAHAASWSLDSEASGFEKMESGFNATVQDYLRLGLLMLHGGRVNGRQVVPEAWLARITAPQPGRVWHRFDELRARGTDYGLMWWLHEHATGRDAYAHGMHGQIIHVSPDSGAVVVRLGAENDPALWWPDEIRRLLDRDE